THGGRGRWVRGELGQLAQVLGDRCQRELVLRGPGTTQPQTVELQDALQVGEQHLDALAFMARLLECLGLGERASYVTGVFVYASGILRAGSFGQHRILNAQTSQSSLLAL